MLIRYLLVVTSSWLLLANTALGQVKIAGPNEGKPNKNVVLTLDVKGNDMKVQTFFNGEDKVPEGSVLTLKNLQDQPIILLNTEQEGIFTFVVVVNIDNKTQLSSHVVKIGNAKPIPPPPPVDPDKPNPKPPAPANSLAADLALAYSKAQDATKLPMLIGIFEEVSRMNYRSYDDMELVLRSTAEKYLQPNDLRPLRDAISSYLLKTLGDDTRKRTIDKGKAAYMDVITALKTIKS
jgi:hypothetical protein